LQESVDVDDRNDVVVVVVVVVVERILSEHTEVVLKAASSLDYRIGNTLSILCLVVLLRHSILVSRRDNAFFSKRILLAGTGTGTGREKLTKKRISTGYWLAAALLLVVYPPGKSAFSVARLGSHLISGNATSYLVILLTGN
jgi:hypothetical protein